MPEADVGQQARQQGAVDVFISRFSGIGMEFQVALDDLHNLAVDVVPFAHP